MAKPDRTRWRLVVLSAALLALGSLSAERAVVAASRRISGRIVHVTTREAYVTLSANHGLRIGDTISVPLVDQSIDRLEVLDVFSGGARVAIHTSRAVPVRQGKVWAEVPVRRQASSEPARPSKAALRAPESRASVDAHWDGVRLERPDRIAAAGTPLKEARPPSGTTGRLSLEYLGLFELGGTRTQNHRIGLLSELSLAGRWLDYSHRLRLRYELSPNHERPYPGSRPYLLVYSLRGGLHAGRIDTELGRIQGGPLPVSTLVDGASLTVRAADGVYLAAFGGLAPRPADLRPALESGVFGVQGSLRLAPKRGAFFISADAGMVGSTFEGSLDRKAMAVQLSVRSSWLELEGLAVADLYASDNPAGRPTVDITVGSVELDFTPLSRLRLETRFDYYRTVMTREALSFLSPAYLAGDAVSSVRGAVLYRVGPRLGFELDLTWQRQQSSSGLLWASGGSSLTGVLSAEDLLWVGASTAWSESQRDYGGRAGYAAPLGGTMSLTASYSLHGYQTTAGLDSGLRHGVAVGLDWTFRRWTAGLDTSASLGADANALLTFATLGYRL